MEFFCLPGCYAVRISSSRCFETVGPILRVEQSTRLLWSTLILMVPIGCNETTVTNYQSTLNNIPEE
jgi:hypothetical protein